MVNIRIKMTDSAAPIIFVPDTTTFPLRKDLPLIPGPPEGVAWLWGKDDKIGQINFLTPTRVKAASAEIKTGTVVLLKYVEQLLCETVIRVVFLYYGNTPYK
jgi:hypothetical protein